jgi:hypothetical protein
MVGGKRNPPETVDMRASRLQSQTWSEPERCDKHPYAEHCQRDERSRVTASRVAQPAHRDWPERR